MGGLLDGVTDAVDETVTPNKDDELVPDPIGGFFGDDDPNSGIIDRAVDVPADFANTTTGTGENVGFFGDLDRALDPRGISEEEAAEPSAETSGVSGALEAFTGAASSAADQAGEATTKPLLSYFGLDNIGGGGGNGQDQQPDQGGGGQLALLAALGLGAFLLTR